MPTIIIDTDIGTNADDAIAIALAARSPEISIKGITTVYGNVKIRAAITNQVLRLAGKENIPIYQGIEQPLLREREVFWAGFEGEGLQLGDYIHKKDKHAVQFIIDMIMNNPGEITLVTIGPLTNIATALIIEPKIAENVKEIIMMAGVTRLGVNRLNLEPIEHNIKCDPEAASIVFRSGAPITMVGLDVTRQVFISRLEIEKMVTCNTPLANLLSMMMETHMNYLKRDYAYLSDPITVSLLLDRSIVKTKQMEITIENEGRSKFAYTIGTPSKTGNVAVSLEIDRQKFLKILNERVFSS
ncbi:nucleoside hydrolase [Pseudogracilibacillus auburnensis]|uniref:Purine nucleosidase n=1 Tax=Pseudogracilibacillus auburnensis TaxID=1494959 RepID=A0A2V3W0V3_9BACI|nr:nucleoside hydrolase [Pseudogracilibacillus auburnensis]PXW87540.1 purine nucleosidase [Pseudogracilibacillus auburnensis]